MKRKAVDELGNSGGHLASKRINTTPSEEFIKASFRPDLFEAHSLRTFREAHGQSTPYPHAVVPSLIDPALLNSVREEVITQISFTFKETDIYRIHQSGDLANLSNLDAESQARLPSLSQLRDALYSQLFRDWISTVTGNGKLSGTKTDMAVNVYHPGSYLLCHDDVIGSRRVSYILYLTDPDDPWQSEWGGALRLYPTQLKTNSKGEETRVPLPEHTVKIPPSAGQLSFFAVRPGESYHDVEEVYHSTDGTDNRRTRIAISGWYHSPQEGEDGYEKGGEKAQAQKSSLAQLEGASDEFDEPQQDMRHFDEPRRVTASTGDHEEVDPSDDEYASEDILTEQDLTFLLEYISPSFLTPDMTEKLAASFEEDAFLQLDSFLGEPFATNLKDYITGMEQETTLAVDALELRKWKIARPPHKHRFAYEQSSISSSTSHVKTRQSMTPFSRLLDDLLRSHAFKKWLALISGLRARGLSKQNIVARRFRRGNDYALASAFKAEQPQLEWTINLTPTSATDKKDPIGASGGNEPMKVVKSKITFLSEQPADFGGQEVYMAADEDDEDTSAHSKTLTHVGKKADPAIYKFGNDEDTDDNGILFTNESCWNQFSVVLRDQGTLRFVKYLSAAATRDRWDIKGEAELSGEVFRDYDSDDAAREAFLGDDNDDNDNDDDNDKEEDANEGDKADGTEDG